MDEIVAQSLKKWPNVPHCYGWLALDARGHWRLRDQPTQDAGLPGDKIAHTALIAFINRNYDCDAAGRWFFQNGPQRVYVNLEIAPFVVHTDPALGLTLHTGAPLPPAQAVYMSAQGRVWLAYAAQSAGGANRIAALDDRDMAQCLPALRMNGAIVDDTALLDWLEGGASELWWQFDAGSPPIPVQRIGEAEIPETFGFVPLPQPETGETGA